MARRASPRNPAIFTLAATAIGAIVSIATKGQKNVPLAITAVFLVFTLVLGYKALTDRKPQSRQKPPKLDPDTLARSLTDTQREYMRIALPGVANDVAHLVKVDPNDVRVNLFGLVPGQRLPGDGEAPARLRMVKDLTHNMDRLVELTIEMDTGKGSTGRAFVSHDINRAIWKDGWGPDDLGDDEELAKVHPDLRWILSVPIFGTSPDPVLVLNIDGLRTRRTKAQLAPAMAHLPGCGHGISVSLGLVQA